MTRLPFSLSLLAISLLLGCPSPRRIVIAGNGNGNGTDTTVPPVVAPVTTGGMGGTPVERLNAVEAHMVQAGFTRVGPAVRNANMQTGGLTAYAINAQPGQCFVPVAVGADGSNLDMIVMDPMGRNVGHNVASDSNPWVRVCTNMQGRYIARMQMAAGAGEYYYALYQGNGDPSLAELLGGPATAAQQLVAIDPNTNQRLAAIDQRLSANRFQRVSQPAGVQLANQADTRRGLNLQAGTCYAFASLGGQGASDTDLFILNADDEVMARDGSSELDAVVEYCPPSTGSYTLRALMYGGAGPLYTVGWQQQQNGVAVAPTANVISTNSTASGTIDESYALIDADIRARGYESYGEIARGALQEGQDRDFSLSLEGGKCYAIVAVGDNGVRNLDLIVRSPRGRQVDRDVAEDARPIVRVCADDTGDYEMKVSMAQGAGNFLYQAYRWPRGTRGPFGLSGLIYVRLGEVTSLLNVEGYEPDGDFAPGRGTLRREGASTHHDLDLPAGQCFAVLVVGGEGVNDIDVRLTRGGQQLSADGTRNAFPNVRYCTQAAGTYRLDVAATAGSGDYFYQVFQRSN